MKKGNLNGGVKLRRGGDTGGNKKFEKNVEGGT